MDLKLSTELINRHADRTSPLYWVDDRSPQTFYHLNVMSGVD